jgi:hypothetical protein
MRNFPTPPGPSEEGDWGRNHVLRLEQQAAIRAMAAAGSSISAIAREFELDRKTVRSFLLLGPPGERRARAEAPSLLDPFKSYLEGRIGNDSGPWPAKR